MKPNRTLSYVGLAIVVVLGLLMIVGAVLPKDYHVQRSVLVDAEPEVVYRQVVDLKLQEAWTPWKANDETMVMSFGDPWVGEGAVYTWTSEGSGNGTYTITKVEPHARIETHIVFEDQGEADGWWTFEPDGDAVRVTWGFDGSIGGILGGYYSLIMDGAVGPTFEDGLARLKQAAESAPPPLDPIIAGRHRGVLTLGPDVAEIVLCGEEQARAFRDDLGDVFDPVRAAAADAPVQFYVEVDAEPDDGTGTRATAVHVAHSDGFEVGCEGGLARGATAAAGTDPAWSATFGPDGLWVDAPDVDAVSYEIVASREADGVKTYTARAGRDIDVVLSLEPVHCQAGDLLTAWTATLAIGDRRWTGCGRRGPE